MIRNTQKLLILLTVLALLVINPVTAQQYMRINQIDGTVIEIAIADIQKLTFDLTTAIEQHPELVKQLLKLKVFPNPAKEFMMIDYVLSEKGNVIIEVFNLNGVLIERITPGLQQPGEYHYRMNVQHLTTGTYVCRVQKNNEAIAQKVIVKR